MLHSIATLNQLFHLFYQQLWTNKSHQLLIKFPKFTGKHYPNLTIALIIISLPPLFFSDELRDWIEESRARPKLVGFLANDDPSAITYAKWTEKSCKDIGIRFEMRKIPREELEEAIIEANEDRKVDGIMIYYPVWGGGHDQYIQNCVSPYKDVEGLCHTFRFNMYHNIRYVN